MRSKSNLTAESPRRLELCLASDEVHSWCASLDCERPVLSRLELTLSPEEKLRADRFVFQSDRNRFLAGRGILRDLLGKYSKLSPTDLQFSHGAQEKPRLNQEHHASPLRFNLSHSHGIVVYAVAFEREVGVDVERILPEFAVEEIAARFFSARELAELRSLSPEARAEGFFLCWTRKEAYVKARGVGLRIPLDSFDVSLTPGQPETLHSPDSSLWTLLSFKPVPGYVGAIVGEGRGWRLRHFEWEP